MNDEHAIDLPLWTLDYTPEQANEVRSRPCAACDAQPTTTTTRYLRQFVEPGQELWVDVITRRECHHCQNQARTNIAQMRRRISGI